MFTEQNAAEIGINCALSKPQALLRKTLFRHKPHRESDLIERAYQDIRECY